MYVVLSWLGVLLALFQYGEDYPKLLLPPEKAGLSNEEVGLDNLELNLPKLKVENESQ